jgi:hypothetical protein
MGYIGLLLNAPYKIDSIVWMMWMMMGMSWDIFLYSYFCEGVNEPPIGKIDYFESVRVLGVNPDFRHFEGTGRFWGVWFV